MNKIKRRLLICLLSATCLTAGAFGLAACNGSNEDSETHSILYTMYTNDSQKGDMTYAQWLENKLAGSIANDGKDGLTPFIGENGNWWIGETDTGVKAQGEAGPQGSQGQQGPQGEAGRGISSIMLLDGEFIVFYTDGTYEVVQETDNNSVKLLKITATDQSGEPVEGAYLKLYAYNSRTYESTVLGIVKTNSNGLATIVYEPVEGASYKVSLADYGETETSPALPEDYEIIYPTIYGMTFPFELTEGSSTLEVPFKNVAGSFKNAVTHGKVYSIPYQRSYNVETKQVTETNGTAGNKFSVDVKAGHYTYLSFLSYVSLSATDDDETNDMILANAAKAASGTYKISISGGTNSVLYYFNGNSGNMPMDDNGEPLYVLNYSGDGTSDTTANSITINNDTLTVRGERIFGIKASADCKITVTVERTGDSEEVPEVQLKPVPVPENLAQWANGATGEKLTLMPVTGAFTAVKGSDGYYHVNSENGPIIVAQLTKAVSRFMVDSLQDYPTATENQESVLYLNGFADSDYDSNGNLLYKYDYNALLSAYCAKVNKDGVYGVDDNLYNLLKSLANMGKGLEIASAAKGCEWLLACYYYEPVGGLAAMGSGTSQDPYILATGVNNIAMTGLDGTAHLSMSVSSAGSYAIDTQAQLSLPEGFSSIIIGNVTYAVFTEAGDYDFTLTGSENSYQVNITAADTLVAVVTGDEDDSGISKDTAIEVNGALNKNIVYDTQMLTDGFYINFSCGFMDDGDFSLTLVGGATMSLIDGEEDQQDVTSLTVSAVHNIVGIELVKDEFFIKINSQTSGNFMLVIQKVSQ